MSPRPAFANGGYKPHANAMTLGKHLAGAMLVWRGENVLNLFFRQFGRVSRRTSGNQMWARSRIMLVAPNNPFWGNPHPVAFTSGETSNCLNRARAAMRPAMALSIFSILLWRGPIKVFRAVVGLVAIFMGAMHFRGWSWTIKSNANKAMGKATNFSPVNTKNMAGVSTHKSRLQYPTAVFTLPVRHNSLNATYVRDFVIRCFAYCAPLLNFHVNTLAYNIRNVK